MSGSSRIARPLLSGAVFRSGGRLFSSKPSIAPSIVYKRVRRGHSFLLSALAGTQASFWGYTAFLTQQTPDPLLSSTWTIGGLGLSVAFGAMVNAYLKRNVAEVSIVHGSTERVRVATHAFGGRISKAVLIEPSAIIGGPKKDDPQERYWTFAHDRPGLKLYYIVDTAKGVQDRAALAAIVRGGEHFLALAHKRRAAEMRDRWRAWEAESGREKR